MIYFILYVSYSPYFTQELYFKSKCMEHLLERIGHYSNGCLATNRGNTTQTKAYASMQEK